MSGETDVSIEDGKLQTDPYGELLFAIGNEDDFWCFDYDGEGDVVRLHAVINSETGSFIMDAKKPVDLPKAEAADYALGLVDAAIVWCADNEVEHDEEGWNQDPYYFYRCVKNFADGGSPLFDQEHRIKPFEKALEV